MYFFYDIRFNGTFVKMSELETVCPSVVVSTIPFQAGFTLPEGLLRRLDTQSNKPVIMDVVYKPARTPLLDQALSRGYACVQGGSMLYEQGAQQFELWNKRKAPRAIMKNAVFNGIETLDE